MNRPQRIVAAPRDGFILRNLSPAQTIGGGMIVEALPKKLRRADQEAVQDALDREKAVSVEKDFVEYCIRTAEAFAINQSELGFRAKMLPGPLKQIIEELLSEGKAVNLDSRLLIHRDTSRDVQQKLLEVVRDFHRGKPESPGLSAEQLHEVSDLKKDVFDGLIERLISQGELTERKHRLALPEHRETFSDDEQELLHQIESLFKTRPFNPPRCEEVIQHAAADPDQVQKTLRILIEQEHLIRIDKDLLFHREAVEKARQTLVSFITEQGGLESVKFKYLLDTTRKFAIPLLDYFDRIGVTRRVGYTRYLRTPTTD